MCHVLRIGHRPFMVVSWWFHRKAVGREQGIIKYLCVLWLRKKDKRKKARK